MYAPILARATEKVKLNIADIYAEDGGRNPANGTLRQNADETRTAADRTRATKRKNRICIRGGTVI